MVCGVGLVFIKIHLAYLDSGRILHHTTKIFKLDLFIGEIVCINDNSGTVSHGRLVRWRERMRSVHWSPILGVGLMMQ